MEIVAHSNEGGHIEGAAQVVPPCGTGLADAGLSPHGGAGGILARIQAGGGDPLPDVETRREQAQFGEQGNGAGGGDSGDAVELLEAFLEERRGADRGR